MTNYQAVVLSRAGLSSVVVGLVATLGAAAVITGGTAIAQPTLADRTNDISSHLHPIGAGPAQVASRRCSESTRTVSLTVWNEGFSVSGQVERTRRISCIGATAELTMGHLEKRRDRLRLVVDNENPRYDWRCSRVGQYYEGLIWKCSRGRQWFTAGVGA